jgi:hypothetical protein
MSSEYSSRYSATGNKVYDTKDKCEVASCQSDNFAQRIAQALNYQIDEDKDYEEDD